MQIPAILRFRSYEFRKLGAHQAAPFYAEHYGRHPITFENSGIPVQCDVRQRSQLIEFAITITRFCQLDLGVSKLFVLDFQLDLMDFEFMDKTAQIQGIRLYL